jgi:DNA-binding CsgD family transcriptional regulator
MRHLRSVDYFRLTQALESVHTEGAPDALFVRLSQAALLAVDAEVSCFDGHDMNGRIGHLGSFPQALFPSGLFPLLAELLPQHPLFSSIILERSNQPLRTSDRTPMGRYYRTALYNEFYRPFSLTHSIVMGLEVADYGWITFAISRCRRDFTAAERQLVGLMRPHFQAAVRLARLQARQHAAPADGSRPLLAPTGLTTRETELLALLAQGLTDKEISQYCRISVRTVQNHLQNVYAKLGVGNRTAALACLQPRG